MSSDSCDVGTVWGEVLWAMGRSEGGTPVLTHHREHSLNQRQTCQCLTHHYLVHLIKHPVPWCVRPVIQHASNHGSYGMLMVELAFFLDLDSIRSLHSKLKLFKCFQSCLAFLCISNTTLPFSYDLFVNFS